MTTQADTLQSQGQDAEAAMFSAEQASSHDVAWEMGQIALLETQFEPEYPIVHTQITDLEGKEIPLPVEGLVLVGTWKGDRALTSNPQLTAQMYEHGPAALDGIGPSEFTTVSKRSGGIGGSESEQKVSIFSGEVSSDGIFAMHSINKDAVISPLSLGNGVPVSMDYRSSNTPNQLGILAGSRQSFSYRSAAAFLDVPAFRGAYANLGISRVEADPLEGEKRGPVEATIPVPSELKRRLETLRAEDSESGMYYPEIELIESGQIDEHTYLETFAAGKYPVGTSDFFYYLHDVASEHLVTLMGLGEPLMDAVTEYSRAILEGGEAHFSQLSGAPEGDFDGSHKLERAAFLIDTMTAFLADVPISEYVPGENYRYSILNTEREEGTYASLLNDFVGTIRADGELEKLQVVQSMLSRGIIKSPDEVTGQLMLDEIVEMAKERLGVEPTEWITVPDDLDEDYI